MRRVRRSLRRGRPVWWWSLGALLLGLLLSLLASRLHERALLEDEYSRLDRLAERSYDAVRAQLNNCGLLVRSVQTLFLSSEQVSEQEFERIYENIRPRETFPSLQAIAYARRVGAQEADPAFDRRDHYLTTMVAPRTGNERLVGLDVVTQPANLAAVEYSRDTDQPAMSAAFQLVQLLGHPGTADGVTIRLPVYGPGTVPRYLTERRVRMIGSLGVSFRVSSLIESALPDETLETLDVHVYDVTGGLRQLLFDSHPGDDYDLVESQPAALHSDIRFGGRLWHMELRPLDAAASAGSWLPRLTLATGILASVLLAGLIWSITNTRARALALAGTMSAQFRESEERFRVLNELLPALVLLARAEDGRLTYANQAARERLGDTADPERGSTLQALFDDPRLSERIVEVAAGEEALVNLHTRLRAASDQLFWATLSVSRIVLRGQPHLLAVANDITELRELTDRLSYQASHDTLTELCNRREFGHRLEAAIARADAGAVPGALIYLDLDQFKLINDTSGHYAGDQLLAQLAGVLREAIRPGDVLARLGGDEFGVLVADAERESALAVADRVREAIDGFAFIWEQRIYTITASLGVVMIDRPGLSRRELLAHADTACYLAKERGRNRVHLFAEDDQESTRRRGEMEWVNRVREALAEGRLSLDYQELERLKPGRHQDGVHLELLLRMHDEDGQPVAPGAFIPAAERYGLMPQIDRWVVETALARFAELHPAGDRVALCAINLSGATVDDEQFAAFVLEALQRHHVPPERLCFEITETAAVGNMTRVVRFFERLRAAGCKIALDDFGAGMSSFGYLKNLPVDLIKIDGSFIRDLESNPMSYSIVRAVTDIGHQIGLEVIAEWVSNARSRDLLRGLGVDYAQGYAIHRPEPALYARGGGLRGLRRRTGPAGSDL